MSIHPPTQGFFCTGGTLELDVRSYVVRSADQELFEALRRGEFCYILTARQMGKSSLMIRTATRLLTEAQVTTGLLDLTTMGKNLTPEQWYAGILNCLGGLKVGDRSLALEDELYDFFKDSTRHGLGPYQRWVETIEHVLLPHCPGPIVLFVDEIDSVLSLPFSADEFFAGIRECYNRRAENPEFARLTFCLLGVATPADLIRDTRSTPFNIGRGIELRDFTEAETLLLAVGLAAQHGRAKAEQLLRRVHYWTGGHPYLTQRLGQALAEQESLTLEQVDQTCRDLFFTQRAREHDDNLSFVRTRILAVEADTAGLLELYGHVLRGKRVHDTGIDPKASLLRLAGIVTRDENGWLRPRNRIYQTVFDRNWVRESMPGAELERQKRAFRRGLFRASALATTLIAALATMLVLTLQARARSDQTAFIATMNLAANSFQSGNVGRTLELLNRYQDQSTYRSRVEWRILWGLCHEAKRIFPELPLSVVALQNLAKENVTLILDQNFVVHRYSLATSQEVGAPVSLVIPGADKRKDRYPNAVFFDQGRRVVVSDFTVRGRLFCFETETGKLLWRSSVHGTVEYEGQSYNAVSVSLAVATNDSVIVSGGENGTLYLVDPKDGKTLLRRQVTPPSQHDVRSAIPQVAVSPDGNHVVAVVRDSQTYILDRPSNQLSTLPMGANARANCAQYSPNGRWLVVVGQERMVWLYDMAKRTLAVLPALHTDHVMWVAFSPTGDRFVTTSNDNTTIVWDTTTRRHLQILRQHLTPVTRATFVGENSVVTVGTTSDPPLRSTTFLWDVRSALQRPGKLYVGAMTPDHTQAVWSGDDGNLHRYDLATGRRQAIYPVGHKQKPNMVIPVVSSLRFVTPDLLVSGGDEGGVYLWEMPEHRRLATLRTAGEQIWSLTSDRAGSRIVMGDLDGEITLWDRMASHVVWQRKPDPFGPAVQHLVFSPDEGLLLASVSDEEKNHALLFLDPGTGKEVRPRQAFKTWCKRLAFSASGYRLALCFADGQVEVRDVRSNRVLHRLAAHVGAATSVVFADDENTLLTGGSRGEWKIWDLATGQETVTLSDMEGEIHTMEWDQSHSLLVVMDAQGNQRRISTARKEKG